MSIRGFTTSAKSSAFKLPWFSQQLQKFSKQLEAQPELNERKQPPPQESSSLIQPTTKELPILSKSYDSHKYSTAWFKISHKKLNDLGRQIANKPIDNAILQMQFSEKRASKRIKSTLVLARDHAIAKGLNRHDLIVKEAYVNRGTPDKRMDIKGRMRTGIKQHPHSKLNILLSPSKCLNQQKSEKWTKILNKTRSSGVVRESPKIINPVPYYNW